ncbi:Ribonuclease H-like protein [Ascosphaera apis ARSEF 7405]|uniref:Ribonuclease H-like protein n=1 Tax=Ascosphaera apis ARSEF 7405 TaxID=392613 RepID=A0A162I0G6_9EURO|nr:Ribonuclease H-like protein [Ascosphaera apis ARSEF 7405]
MITRLQKGKAQANDMPHETDNSDAAPGETTPVTNSVAQNAPPSSDDNELETSVADPTSAPPLPASELDNLPSAVRDHLDALQQELSRLKQQASLKRDLEAPPDSASPPRHRQRTDTAVPQPPTSSSVDTLPTQTEPANELNTSSLAFAPASATGVPNIQPGVDLDALLLERRTFRVKRSGDPSDKLDGKDRRAYKPWKRAILHKIADNLPAILYHHEQVNYALSQLSGDLLYTMSHWVTNHPDCLFPDFINEMEGFLAIPLLQSDARREIEKTRQKQTENVTELYLRLTPFFTDANLSVDEQIDKFFIALRKNLSTQLACKVYSSLETLRDDAQRLENRLHDLETTQGKIFYSQPAKTAGSYKTSITGPNLSDEHRASNRHFGPVVDKPARWSGPCQGDAPALRLSILASTPTDLRTQTSLLPDIPHMCFSARVSRLSDDFNINTTTFLDSGATGNFVSSDFAALHSLPLYPLSSPLSLKAADDSIICQIQSFTQFTFILGPHSEVLSFYVAPVPIYSIVIGLPWLALHNPLIDWVQRTLTFQPDICYPKGCISSCKPLSIQARAKDPGPPPQPSVSIDMLSAEEFFTEACATDSETFLFLHTNRDASPTTYLQSLSTVQPLADKSTATTIDCLKLAAAITDQDLKKHMDGPPEYSLEELKQRVPAEYHDFLDVFSRELADTLPKHGPEDHRIDLIPGSVPPCTKNSRPMPPQHLEALRKYLAKESAKGYIRPSNSPAAAPVLVIRKPHGGIRVCVDYRGLNAITIKTRCAMPLLSDTLNSLQGAIIFSAMDIVHAFNRLRIAAGHEWLTSFITRYGQFEYLVMPFGLCNAPSTFQAYINRSLQDYIDNFCSAYIDDIIVFSKSLQEHRNHIKKVLLRLRDRKLYLDIDKCSFHQEEITYLGVLVSRYGLRIHPDKLEAIKSWRVPRSVHDVQVFNGFVNFFRRFLPGSAQLLAPLYDLTKGEVYTKPSGKRGLKYNTFVWSDACDHAFQKIKELLVSAPVLAHYNPDKPTWVETDASNFVVAGVLSQEDHKGSLRPIAYYSRKLKGAELNYCIYDRELLAIVRAFETWRPELLGVANPAKVVSDHQSLRYFMSTKQLSARQARWAEFLSQFNFQITYAPGSTQKADALTRRSQDIDDTAQKQRLTTLLSSDKIDPDLAASFAACWLAPITTESQSTTPTESINNDIAQDSSAQFDIIVSTIMERLQRATLEDDIFGIIISSITSGARRLPASVRRAGYHISLSDLELRNDLVLFKNKILVPPVDDIRLDLLYYFHSNPLFGHPGERIMFDNLLRSYYWPSMRRDCTRYVRNCHLCVRAKASNSMPQGFLHPLPVSEQPWLDVTMDLIESLPPCTRKNRTFSHIWVAVCRLTKDKIIEPLTSKSDSELIEVFHRRLTTCHGAPMSVVCDRAQAFMSSKFTDYCKQHSIKIDHSSADHLQTDGQTEIVNKSIKNYLRATVNHLQDNWVDVLPDAEFVWRNSVCRSTGMSPFFAIHGFNARTPLSHPTLLNNRQTLPPPSEIVSRRSTLNQLLYRNLLWAQDEQAFYANAHRTQQPLFRVGDLVFVKSLQRAEDRPSHSLSHKRDGPWPIIRIIDNKAFQIALPEYLSQRGVSPIFSPDRLTLSYSNPFPGQRNEAPPPSATMDNHQEWILDEIIDCRVTRSNDHEYKATFVGWPTWNSNPPWQHWTNFQHWTDKILAFHARHPHKPSPPQFFLEPQQ